MVKMLDNVVNRGTAYWLRSIYNLTAEMGGKTGTTQNQSDGWYIGIAPSLTAGVWVGAEDRSVHFAGISKGQGAYMALPIYGLFYAKGICRFKFEYIPGRCFQEAGKFQRKSKLSRYRKGSRRCPDEYVFRAGEILGDISQWLPEPT